ncbi:hypothetical protein [Acidiphilium sp.]|uniref:hypothetical protein n=1 Tax=Acidiphilium sp. TaxID=527 RepID=UPI002587E1FF|nr:hypothetical protein [Acidiphilium sp.]
MHITLNVVEDGVDFVVRKLHRQILRASGRGLHHVYLFGDGDVVGCRISKASRRVRECGDSALVGVYSKAADESMIRGDVIQHMRDIGITER